MLIFHHFGSLDPSNRPRVKRRKTAMQEEKSDRKGSQIHEDNRRHKKRRKKGTLEEGKPGTTEQVSHAVCPAVVPHKITKENKRKRFKKANTVAVFYIGNLGKESSMFPASSSFPPPWSLTVVQGKRECIVACPHLDFLRPSGLPATAEG